MDYFNVLDRLRANKKEIHELRMLNVVDIQDKIIVLKKINQLLREQNNLLLFRQDLLKTSKYISNKIFNQRNYISKDSEKVA